MKSQVETAIKRTIRRHQLREIVPLADTTIYDMERRGEFPRRFSLTSRCVVWDLAEVEAWLEDRRRASCRFPLRSDPVFPSRIDPGDGMSRRAGFGSSW